MTKVLIVGGGVAGLTAGIYARNAGYEAEIYEKNPLPGGECTGWDREGYHIDNCIHWLMGTSPGTALHEIWRTTGALGDSVEVYKANKMYTSELNGQRISLWHSIDQTEHDLLRLSPDDAAEIITLMKNCRLCQQVTIPAEKPPEFYNALDLLKMGVSMRGALKIFKTYEGMDTQDLMNRFSHPLIRCMLSDFCTRESLASSFPMAYGNFAGGDGGVPKGGSRAMALRMRDRFESLGGRLYTGKSAERILIEGERAAGIQLDDGTRVYGDFIVPACDTSYTFGRLLPKERMDPILRRMYEERAAFPVYGMFQVAFALNYGLDALDGETILDCSSLRYADYVGDRLTVKTYGYEYGFAPKGKQILQTLMGFSEAGYDDWKALSADPAAYKAKKEELALRTMELLESRFTAFAGNLRILDIWTPITYERWCNAYKGYNQAFMITKASGKDRSPSPYVQGLPNVVLAGQWLSPPGGLPGAAITGKYAIQRIQRLEVQNAKQASPCKCAMRN